MYKINLNCINNNKINIYINIYNPLFIIHIHIFTNIDVIEYILNNMNI